MTDVNQNFEARLLTPNDYKAFTAVYNDFRSRAVSEYNFELEPLDFEGFVEAVEKKLIECVVLFENSIPVAFLVYTTAISEAIELNIIHSLKMENMVERAMYLVKKFLELTKAERLDKVVCYPSVSKGSSSRAFRILSAAIIAPFESTPGRITLNSSPPIRAAVSIDRAFFFNTFATVLIAKSP